MRGVSVLILASIAACITPAVAQAPVRSVSVAISQKISGDYVPVVTLGCEPSAITCYGTGVVQLDGKTVPVAVLAVVQQAQVTITIKSSRDAFSPIRMALSSKTTEQDFFLHYDVDTRKQPELRQNPVLRSGEPVSDPIRIAVIPHDDGQARLDQRNQERNP